MAEKKDEKYYKKDPLIKTKLNDPESDEGESGTDGQSGQIAFHDFLAPSSIRDDLPFDEQKRLLTIHQMMHEDGVKKQKQRKDALHALKEGETSLQTSYRQGLTGGGMDTQYKIHLLSTKAQFSGIDRQVIAIPTEQVADTNDKLRKQLDNQYRLRHAPSASPRFNPKPQFNRW